MHYPFVQFLPIHRYKNKKASRGPARFSTDLVLFDLWRQSKCSLLRQNFFRLHRHERTETGRGEERKIAMLIWSILQLALPILDAPDQFHHAGCVHDTRYLLAILRQDPPLEAILVIFGRGVLIFFFFGSKALGKIWKMTPIFCACAVVITLEMQKCRKRAPRSVKFNIFINCGRQKRFSQNERRRADLQNAASKFLIFA